MPRRSIQKIFLAREQPEGAGAVVRRSIGTPKLRHLTPFLMLDHFNIPPSAGFPDHPHRGQETITYLLAGGVEHEDIKGNRGRLNPGDLQFMTAGRGIVHAEMPAPDAPETVGIQLWVDLPRDLKMCAPRYRDLRAEEIPRATTADGLVEVKVISGRSLGVESLKDLAYTPVWLLDITVRPGGQIEQELPKNWNAFAYLLDGTATFSDGRGTSEPVEAFHNVIFKQHGEGNQNEHGSEGHDTDNDTVLIQVDSSSSSPARIIFIAGIPLDQPVVQHGPFVMTSRDEIMNTMVDYQTGSNGFERAHEWHSEIGERMGRVH